MSTCTCTYLSASVDLQQRNCLPWIQYKVVEQSKNLFLCIGCATVNWNSPIEYTIVLDQFCHSTWTSCAPSLTLLPLLHLVSLDLSPLLPLAPLALPFPSSPLPPPPLPSYLSPSPSYYPTSPLFLLVSFTLYHILSLTFSDLSLHRWAGYWHCHVQRTNTQWLQSFKGHQTRGLWRGPSGKPLCTTSNITWCHVTLLP